MALGSASELEYELLLASDLGLFPGTTYSQFESAIVSVKRMLTGLARRLTADGRRPTAQRLSAQVVNRQMRHRTHPRYRGSADVDRVEPTT